MRRIVENGREESIRRGTGPGRPGDGQRGFVLVIVLILIAALALLGLAASRNMLTDIGIAENQGGNTRAFYAAEAAAEYSYNQLSLTLAAAGTVPVGGITYTNSVPAIAGCTVNSAAALPDGSLVQRTITATNGQLSKFKGLYSWVQTYTITATATDNNTSATSTVILDAVSTLVPIFQFGVFYNNTLEMNPGANLTIPVNGWIQTNSNLYTSTSATETIDSNITSAGQIIHGRAPGDPQAVGTGNVSIEGANGIYYNLVNGSQTLSNGNYVNNSNWASTVTQWGGTVAAQEEGVQSLNLPLPAAAASNPEYILNQTGQGTMGSLAAVTITNGTATDAKGNTLSTCYYNSSHKNGWQLIIDSGCNAAANENSVTTGTVYDYREGKTAETTDIDVDEFQTTAAGQYLAGAAPANGGDSGVLYVTTSTNVANSQTEFNAVRLWDGATLTSPLTIATNLPAYVEGNFNSSATPQPAAIMSDATTVLSNQWSNSYDSGTPLTGNNGRNVTSALTINADIMTGNTATTSAGYGGGFENFIRFLENWSGENFNFGGSLVQMWQATKVTAPWQNTGIYYNPPNRQYTFGVFGTKWPPGTPNLVVTTRGTWRHQ
jgi:Tfp pilus assembly protein PilX